MVEGLARHGIQLHRAAEYIECVDQPCDVWLFRRQTKDTLLVLPWPTTEDHELIIEDMQRNIADRLSMDLHERKDVFGWSVFPKRITPKGTPTRHDLSASASPSWLIYTVLGALIALCTYVAIRDLIRR